MKLFSIHKLSVLDIVKLRDGTLLVLIPSEEGGLVGVNYTQFEVQIFTSYNEDLTHKYVDLFDIVAVYKSSSPYRPRQVVQFVESILYGIPRDPNNYIHMFGGWDWMSPSVIPEPPLELTLEEVERRLGYPVKIIDS